ncbi:MAG: hypothetical protein ACQEP7_04085, partial [bacterium]
MVNFIPGSKGEFSRPGKLEIKVSNLQSPVKKKTKAGATQGINAIYFSISINLSIFFFILMLEAEINSEPVISEIFTRFFSSGGDLSQYILY